MKSSLALKLSLFVLLGACKLAGSEPRLAETNTNSGATSIFFYLAAEEYNVGNEQLAKAMSNLQGYSLITTDPISFTQWSQPQNHCLYTSDDRLALTTARALDIGDLQISGPGAMQNIAKDPQRMIFLQSLFLSPGTYSIGNTEQRNLRINQDFVVPEATAPHIKLSSGQNPAVELSAPQVPSQSDPNYRVTISKTAPLKIEFAAPADANYVRVKMSDGSESYESNITCYGALDRPLQIPAAALRYMRSTEDATLMVDFMSTRLNTGLPRIKESFISVASRYLFGLKDFVLDTQKLTAHFGVLHIE